MDKRIIKSKEYWFDPKISWKSFKAICDKFPDSGPVPKHIDKVLWQMLRDRKINMGLHNLDDPIFITSNPIPQNAILLKSP